MKLKRLFALTWLTFVAALLFLTTIAGAVNVYDNIPLVDTTLRRLTLIFQMFYTASGGVALVALVMKRHWFVQALGTWAAAITITALLAPPAWGDTGIGAALAAGVSTAFVSVLIVWWTHRIVRRIP